MNRIDILKQIKELLIKTNTESLNEALEIKALKELINSKSGIIDSIIKGYKTSNIVYKNGNPVLLLKYKNGKAKVTVDYVEENDNQINAKYNIRKLSDYENTLSHYTYDSKSQTIEYETCSRDNRGISNCKGYIERDKNLSNHTAGVTRFYDFKTLNENIKLYDVEREPMSIVSNVVKDSKLNIKPLFEEYIETLDGNIIVAETKVNTDDHYLFKKGNIVYNAELEESDNKERIRR